MGRFCQASIQTLAIQNGDLNFGHVQPTPMFRGVMKLQLPHDPPSLLRFEDFIQGRRRMGVQVIQDHPDHFGLWKVDVNEIFSSR
jgi:hypothetical protein